MSTEVFNPSDADLAYIGLDARQIVLLRGHPAEVRLIVYEEQLRLLMENVPGSYGDSQIIDI